MGSARPSRGAARTGRSQSAAPTTPTGDQYMLDVIFHARMRRHECLTADPAAAAVVYIPFYAGLDAAMHLGSKDLAARDALSRNEVDWLAQRPEWRPMGGRDHFLVSGRGTWDCALMSYPTILNTTFLTTEASPWHGNDFVVSFPSHFHPSSDADAAAWQDRMRRVDRAWLWGFAGEARGGNQRTVRAQIMELCGRSSRCALLGVPMPGHYAPGCAMRLLESADFCVLPRGDGYTRKSTFDTILAGCIPVFFHPISAYLQYMFRRCADGGVEDQERVRYPYIWSLHSPL